MGNIKRRPHLIQLFILWGVTFALSARAANHQPHHTATPIEHVFVLVLQNETFDRYFGSYPHALNPAGAPLFVAKKSTPSVDGFTPSLLQNNPNASPPYRLGRKEYACAFPQPISVYRHSWEAHGNNRGFVKLMDLDDAVPGAASDDACTPAMVMGYYDGNTVTALWNYAQYYTLADHFYSDNFGHLNTGGLDLIAGTHHFASPTAASGVSYDGTLEGYNYPKYDDASTTKVIKFPIEIKHATLAKQLNKKAIHWGWFAENFSRLPHTSPWVVGSFGNLIPRYDARTVALQYFADSSNPHHQAPTAIKNIGITDAANHIYDLNNLWQAFDQGVYPELAFISPSPQHSGQPEVSSALDEQHFVVDTVNRLMRSPIWKNSAVFITYTNASSWYDHVTPPSYNHQQQYPLAEAQKDWGRKGRYSMYGYGPRLPFLLISPYSRENHVAHRTLAQSSISRFIEHNWGLDVISKDSLDRQAPSLLPLFDFSQSQLKPLILNPTTGEVITHGK